MEQIDFLELHVFTGLKNLNASFSQDQIHFFSEEDFKEVLNRVEHLGIGLYSIEAQHNNETFSIVKHDEFKKKATDAKWYKKAFLTFTHQQKGMRYAATYKVSAKLLAR